MFRSILGIYAKCASLFFGTMMFPLVAFPSIYPSSPVPKQPGVFDNYVLAMSYGNDFCVSKPNIPECQDDTEKDAGMVLHGLWPNRHNDPKHEYGCCGKVSASDLGND